MTHAEAKRRAHDYASLTLDNADVGCWSPHTYKRDSCPNCRLVQKALRDLAEEHAARARGEGA